MPGFFGNTGAYRLIAEGTLTSGSDIDLPLNKDSDYQLEFNVEMAAANYIYGRFNNNSGYGYRNNGVYRSYSIGDSILKHVSGAESSINTTCAGFTTLKQSTRLHLPKSIDSAGEERMYVGQSSLYKNANEFGCYNFGGSMDLGSEITYIKILSIGSTFVKMFYRLCLVI